MMGQRGSDKHGPMRDDERKKEIEGQLRGGHPTRADEALEAEPPADDDPKLTPPEPRPAKGTE